MDRHLVERAIAGDREAYTELVNQSIDRSYAIATLMLRDPEWARDATQEAYVDAWRDLSSLRDPGLVRTVDPQAGRARLLSGGRPPAPPPPRRGPGGVDGRECC